MTAGWRRIRLPHRVPRAFALLAGLALLSPVLAAAPPTSIPTPIPAAIRPAPGYGALPLSFARNDGQMAPEVKFYERGDGHGMQFTPGGVYLALRGGNTGQSGGARVHLRFLAAAQPELQAEEPLPGKVNYFIGRDPQRWQINVPTYRRVTYHGLYPGVDLAFYGNGRQLEYDVIVAPGADPGRVAFRYEGIEGLRLAPDGALEIELAGGGALQQRPPRLYQDIEGARHAVAGRFRLIGDETSARAPAQLAYGFEIGAYDPRYPLVIDPVLVYSTYLGGGNNDRGSAIAVDGSGNAYVAGETWSMDFPTLGAYKASADSGYSDVFVSKINAAGTALVYSTYFGGSELEEAHDIAVDSAGSVFLLGTTESDDLPVSPGALQPARNADFMDVFVAKLGPSGATLDYSTYIGGTNDDFAYGIAIDAGGSAYIAGETWSEDLPTVTPIYTAVDTGNHQDAFVAKLNATGTALVYSTYLGGDNRDRAYAIAIDGAGNAYVTGTTESTNFPLTPAPIQATTAMGFNAAFVTKLNAAGSALIYSTYLSGSYDDFGNAIAVDAAGNAYVAGDTWSVDFPTVNPLYTVLDTGNNRDAFVARINAAGSALDFSTYLGGGNRDAAYGLALDGSGNVYVTGMTRSTDFPVLNAAQAGNAGDEDAFVAKIDATGATLLYSTYLGGTDEDLARGIAVDGAGAVYVIGETRSPDFPTAGALQPAGSPGFRDAFVTKLQ